VVQGRGDRQQSGASTRGWSLVSRSAEETFALGAALGVAASPDVAICLFGDLGSGKTKLTQGIAAGLSVPTAYVVTSPTFTYVNEYPGRLPLFHIDLYRISSADELADLGWEEYLEAGGVVVIEWAERAETWLPEKRIDITITITGADARRFDIAGLGDFPQVYEMLTLRTHGR
jgi:tRNA threonylcarbamoyladenosine biosynthesis protein TsaE